VDKLGIGRDTVLVSPVVIHRTYPLIHRP